MLPALVDGAHCEHADGCRADDESQTQEALEEEIELLVGGLCSVDLCLRIYGYHAVADELRLHAPGDDAGVCAIPEHGAVDGEWW